MTNKKSSPTEKKIREINLLQAESRLKIFAHIRVNSSSGNANLFVDITLGFPL
jgi:hypothetical protein